MRNRAKCALCQDIIEVLVHNEYVTCKCGEITIGSDLYARATDFKNFLRIDEEGNEKAVTYHEQDKQQNENVNGDKDAHKPTKDELILMVDEMIKSYEHLPQHALLAPVSHADQLSLLMLVSSLFKSL
jgi:hypothetical protein